jgi:alpha-L-rhamnosidase
MKNYFILFFSLVLLFSCNQKEQDFSVVHLQCEYLNDAIGIDAESPRFSWEQRSEVNGFTQTTYHIIIGENASFSSGSILWDSGKQFSDLNHCAYAGQELKPFTKYFWQVTVGNADGAEAKSEVASFETGMMGMKNWKGSWITDTRDINLKPAPYFRKELAIEKDIKTARAYIAVAGLYELSVNGQRIGDHRLDPTYTRFDRRTLYVTYDVTAQLKSGQNAIGVLLGNGWYNHQSTAVWYFHEAVWRARPKFCMDLRLEYDDGSIETIGTDATWKTDLSPVVFNSIYTAEHYDARLEQPGWDQAEFDDAHWRNAILTPAPSNNIMAQTLRPIRNVEKISPISRVKKSNTNYIFDLGQNISGVSELRVSGEKDTKIHLIHGEMVDKDGHVDLANIDVHYRPTDDSDPFQTDIFILGGNGLESFMPRFNYKGFQYVEIKSDKPIELDERSLTGYFMHSDVPPVGKIAASNPTIEKIWQAGNNSYLSNLFGYPTDCPQREKNGWTGDAHIAIETGLYSYDAITVYEKWMADHRDEQQPNGVLPAIIPTDGWGYHWANGPDWTSTIALIPWNVYVFYGDTKILSDNYENIKRYVDHIDQTYPFGLTDWGLGDWVPVKSRAPKELTSTAYYFADATILSKAAAILGYDEDEQKYAALAEKIKSAFNEKYLDKSAGIYGVGMQTELSVPLFWGLVPDEYRQKVADNLAKKVEQDGFHIDVGILGSKAILNALSENGYADVAYQVASQETFPSWGWWIVNGATTFYENWDIEAKRDLSLNHIMFGEINAWYYKALGGIKPDPENPGFKNVLLKPNFVDGLDYFTAEHDGPYGKIISSWKRENESVIYQVTIPANSSATLSLVGNSILLDDEQIKHSSYATILSEGKEMIIHLESGSYEFKVDLR